MIDFLTNACAATHERPHERDRRPRRPYARILVSALLVLCSVYNVGVLLWLHENNESSALRMRGHANRNPLMQPRLTQSPHHFPFMYLEGNNPRWKSERLETGLPNVAPVVVPAYINGHPKFGTRIPGVTHVLGHPTIYVAISSYRDGRCSGTVESIFSSAAHPERVRVSVVDQTLPGDRACAVPLEPCSRQSRSALCVFRSQIDTFALSAEVATGPTFARSIGTRMYAGETYVMQIDAHLIFAENWDVDIVRMHTEMKNTHIVLSSYLSGLTKYIKSDGSRMIPKTIPLTCHFDVEKTSLGMVVPKAQPEVPNPIPGSSVGPVPFIAAGFSFAIGQFFVDVPYDPHLPQIFHGEEFDWSVRAFTHGYDVYNPSTSVCFHNYTRGNVVIMFDDPHWSERKHIEMRSRRRILYKTGVRIDFRPRLDFDESELVKYGVGNVRSTKSYFGAFGFEVAKGRIVQTIDSTTRCKRLRETPRRGGLLHNAQREVDGDPRGITTSHLRDTFPSPFIFGYDSCPHFRAYASAPVLGPAGLFNTGTNYLAELLRINCERTDSEIPVSVWQVPWGKHNPPEWHRWNHETSTSHMQNIMPVVTIKNPLTWMKSMCRHPYAVALKGKCPSSVEKTENVVTYGGGRERTYTSLLHLWAEWYRAYFETKMPHLIVRYEDLLFHPSETVSKICKCVGGTMRKGSFKNVNKSAKSGKGHGWGGNGRATALALHRDAAKRVEGYSLEDLLFVRNNENAYRLMRLFNYSHDLTIETTAATRIFKPFNARFVEARMRSVPDKIDVRHLVKLVQRTRPGVPSFPPAPLPASELEELCVGRQNDADGRLLQRVTVASAAEVNAAEKRAVHLRSSHGVAHSSTMLYSRILCVVYCTQSDHDEKIGAIRDTWANRCDGFAAMSTATDPELPSLKVPHEGKEEYHNIWQKMRSIFILLYRRYYDDFEWFTIGGSDLYVVVENLRLYLNSDEIVNATRGPDGRAMPFYLGRRFALDGDRTRMFNSGGAGYVLNRAALKILAENVLDNPVCEPNAHTSAEDVQVAKCLKRAAGVLPHDTRDNFGRERFHPFTPGKHLSYRVPPDGNDWYAKYAIDLTFGEACCSERSISFHYVSPARMRAIHTMLYGCTSYSAFSKTKRSHAVVWSCHSVDRQSGTFKQLRYALESLQFALENSHYWKPSMLGSSIHIPCEVPFDDIFDLAELERAFPLTVLNKSASTTTPLLHVDCMGNPTTCVHDPELWSNIIQATRPSAPLRRVAGEIVQELPSKFVCIHARIEDDFKSVFEGTYRYKTVVQIRNMVRNYDFGDIETLYIAGGDVFDLAQWYDIGFAEIRHKNRTVKSMLEGSVIDMEVCKHAEVHVGTAGSIWDEFLHEWRYVNGRLSTLMYAADRPVVGLEPFVGANDEVHLIRSSNLPTKPYHSLETLFGESGSDKARYGNGKGYHGYTRYYERIFTAIRTDAVRLLEIGVSTGHSMKVWQQYFVNAEHVYGIGFGNFQSTPSQECSTNAATKVDTQVPCTIFKGDQSDQSFLNHFVSETGGMFDIIIDDGSHVPSHQLLSFETLWPSVKPGGMYIVEDIETNWWKPSAKIYGYTLNNQPNVVDKWKGLVETLNREFTNGRSPLTDENLAVYGSIASVEFGQNIIIFYKVLQGEERFLSKPYRFKHALVDQ